MQTAEGSLVHSYRPYVVNSDPSDHCYNANYIVSENTADCFNVRRDSSTRKRAHQPRGMLVLTPTSIGMDLGVKKNAWEW